MAKYSIELNEQELENVNYLVNLKQGDLPKWETVFRAIEKLREFKPETNIKDLYTKERETLQELVMDQLVYGQAQIKIDYESGKDIKITRVNPFISNSGLKSGIALQMEQQTLAIKVAAWLLENNFNHLPTAECLKLNDPYMVVKLEQLYKNPYNVIKTVTDKFLEYGVSYISWNDDEDTVPGVSATGGGGMKPSGSTQAHALNGSKIISSNPWGIDNNGGWSLGYPGKQNQTHKMTSCYHEWKIYTGLNEQFEYCTKCDIKKGENK